MGILIYDHFLGLLIDIQGVICPDLTDLLDYTVHIFLWTNKW